MLPKPRKTRTASSSPAQVRRVTRSQTTQVGDIGIKTTGVDTHSRMGVEDLRYDSGPDAVTQSSSGEEFVEPKVLSEPKSKSKPKAKPKPEPKKKQKKPRKKESPTSTQVPKADTKRRGKRGAAAPSSPAVAEARDPKTSPPSPSGSPMAGHNLPKDTKGYGGFWDDDTYFSARTTTSGNDVEPTAESLQRKLDDMGLECVALESQGDTAARLREFEALQNETVRTKINQLLERHGIREMLRIKDFQFENTSLSDLLDIIGQAMEVMSEKKGDMVRVKGVGMGLNRSEGELVEQVDHISPAQPGPDFARGKGIAAASMASQEAVKTKMTQLTRLREDRNDTENRRKKVTKGELKPKQEPKELRNVEDDTDGPGAVQPKAKGRKNAPERPTKTSPRPRRGALGFGIVRDPNIIGENDCSSSSTFIGKSKSNTAVPQVDSSSKGQATGGSEQRCTRPKR
ncbi:hypothetical protein CcaverHIS002_0211740 [Cutaneotrichosporon cavernicola]|uniref:Uncharacterized protein n=1 Tax=Cutaneotrichosporon cavernicola TaxID=279322 RepID=A0AA48L2P1_9TREE|nr:uncharacterized protein CcaverHIS019_0211750 [Cutaneotrichosporon cavernicola]BEI82014.1 hypothetical protein CcaverHIS002_0211740 [Cutaneotrichosporon cavernicola]BEI89813.1 hypothetical protein CcaverHIS019_0211750 [Cutaneotrichosporon cavernicola]BEJ05363.1 hypothetical protein CcaverHIS641_0211800 [Cutaneotrichosporon cavernicola]